MTPSLSIDKLALSYRFGEGNHFPLQIIGDVMESYIRDGRATPMRPGSYPNNYGRPATRCTVTLTTFPRATLFVEYGVAFGKDRRRHPYAKFELNANRIATRDTTRDAFIRVMDDLLPAGGYSELVEEGKVLYAEFACDIPRVDVSALDAYCPQMRRGERIQNETIYLKDGRAKRETEICIYDKKRSDWKRHHHLRRPARARIEVKRRFNNNRHLRELSLPELAQIDNPFESLILYDRTLIPQIFTAKRHASFLAKATQHGVQHALAGTRGADRERRLRMLEECRLPQWRPDEVWRQVEEAIAVACNLGR